MFTLTIKGLWAHKLRYALTGLAVILGVAFMAGTTVLTDTMEQTFNGVFESANDGIDVIVRSGAAIEGDTGDVRERVDGGLVERVAAVEGVDAAAGSIQGFAQLVDADGEASQTDGFGLTIGANWIADERLNPFTLASGRVPEGHGDVVLDERTARIEGWTLGDRITVLTKAGPTTMTLVGTATYGAVDGLPGASLVATDDSTAQALFAEVGRYDSVVVAAAADVTTTELSTRISSDLGAPAAGLEVITGSDDTADKQADLKQDLDFFNKFLMAFAYVALFVGTFIIYNTFSIVVAQRMRDLAMLRAIGARRSQVLRSIVLESVVVGVVAAGVGLVGGIGLSFGLRALLAGVGLDIPSGPLVVTTSTIVTAFVVGVAVSVLSAVMPAVRGSAVRPIAALRDVAVDRSGLSVRRVVPGVVLGIAGVLGFAAGLGADAESALPFIGLGALAVLLGVCTLGPVLVRPAMRVLGSPAARLSGVTGRYARENARRTPKRTAATASALMIGVALVGFITILAASTKTSVAAAVDTSFRADYVIDSGSWSHGFATTIEDDLAAVPDLDVLSPVRVATAEVDGSATQVTAVDTGTFDELYDLEVTTGSLAGVRDGGFALPTTDAADRGLSLGDAVAFRFGDGSTVDLVLRALYDASLVTADSPWLVDIGAFEGRVADQFDRQVFVSITEGSTAAGSRAAIDDALAGWPNAEIQDQAEFKESITAEIDMLLNLIYGLLALAVVIALIGIANTLALSVHERTRELGVLRAIGMHRRQVRSAVRWESLLIAALGAVLGTVLAVGGAWGIVQALDDEGVTTLTLPLVHLAIITGAAGLAGVVAATAPARRAARLDILRAVASE
jgi:putative ABC transport system permease protein